MITLNQQDVDTLLGAGRQGKTFEQACKEVGHCRKYVRDALINQGLEWDAKEVFPMLKASPESGIKGMSVIPPEMVGHLNVDSSLAHVRAATMAWRKSA